MRSLIPLLLLLLALAPAARANGRFPATTAVFFQPGDTSKVFVGATFGLLVSPDDGQTWRWVCEGAIGYSGVVDPAYGATATGALLAGTYTGLSVSRDGGCSWAFAGGALAGAWISDLRVAGDGAIWLTTANGTSPNGVYVSRDDARTFQPAGRVVTDAAQAPELTAPAPGTTLSAAHPPTFTFRPTPTSARAPGRTCRPRARPVLLARVAGLVEGTAEAHCGAFTGENYAFQVSHAGESQPVYLAVLSVTGFSPDAAMWQAALAGRSGHRLTVTIERGVFFRGDLTEGPYLAPAGSSFGVAP